MHFAFLFNVGFDQVHLTHGDSATCHNDVALLLVDGIHDCHVNLGPVIFDNPKVD
jgi:hypothetical protein